MNATFKQGDKVYHRNLEWYGIFYEYDVLDVDTCTVVFTKDDGYEDERRVSINMLDKCE